MLTTVGLRRYRQLSVFILSEMVFERLLNYWCVKKYSCEGGDITAYGLGHWNQTHKQWEGQHSPQGEASIPSCLPSLCRRNCLHRWLLWCPSQQPAWQCCGQGCGQARLWKSCWRHFQCVRAMVPSSEDGLCHRPWKVQILSSSLYVRFLCLWSSVPTEDEGKLPLALMDLGCVLVSIFAVVSFVAVDLFLY